MITYTFDNSYTVHTSLLGTETGVKRFRSIDAEIDNMRIIGCNGRNQWQKIGIHAINTKWASGVRRNGSKAQKYQDSW
jgi:hypothetical protein